MKTAEVILHCFVLLVLFLAIVFLAVVYMITMDNDVARAEHPTLYLAFNVVTVLCVAYFAFYSFYVWRRIDRS